MSHELNIPEITKDFELVKLEVLIKHLDGSVTTYSARVHKKSERGDMNKMFEHIIEAIKHSETAVKSESTN